MTAARMLSCLMALTGGLLLFGCSPRSTTLNHVSGKVLYKGVALHGGIIVFSPDASKGESGAIAISKIQSDGSYVLLTDDAQGVSAGWYRVTVASLTDQSFALDSSASSSAVPEKYRDPQLSQLNCEVKANRDNHLDFNLD